MHTTHMQVFKLLGGIFFRLFAPQKQHIALMLCRKQIYISDIHTQAQQNLKLLAQQSWNRHQHLCEYSCVCILSLSCHSSYWPCKIN